MKNCPGNLTSTCSRKLNFIRKLAHKSYGAEAHTLMRLKAIIRSWLDYGAFAYNCSSHSSTVCTLDAIQLTTLCLTSGAHPADLGEMLISYRRELFTGTYFLPIGTVKTVFISKLYTERHISLNFEKLLLLKPVSSWQRFAFHITGHS